MGHPRKNLALPPTSSPQPLRLFDRPFRASFVSRPNRFLVECTTDGQRLLAFLPNPGRLRELLLPGAILHLVEDHANPLRRTSLTAVAVERDGIPIMLHTHQTNQVARYLIENDLIPALCGTEIVKAEVTVGKSRFDFLLRDGKRDVYVEVKSCTLVGERTAMFPDAVTVRGARHLRELANLVREGNRGVVLFIVHWPSAEFFMPDYHTDLNFAQTLCEVRNRVDIVPVSVLWNGDLSLKPVARSLTVPWHYIEKEAKDRGSYLIILFLKDDLQRMIGKLGLVSFRRGFYVYVGSAMANLTARIERHRRLRKTIHWHIDAFRDSAEIISALPIRSSQRIECELAGSISAIAQWALPGFGSSDCRCPSHLFGFVDNPLVLPSFQKTLQYFRMDRFEG